MPVFPVSGGVLRQNALAISSGVRLWVITNGVAGNLDNGDLGLGFGIDSGFTIEGGSGLEASVSSGIANEISGAGAIIG